MTDKEIIEKVLELGRDKAIKMALDDGLEISKEDINDKNFIELNTFIIEKALSLKEQETEARILGIIDNEIFTEKRLKADLENNKQFNSAQRSRCVIEELEELKSQITKEKESRKDK